MMINARISPCVDQQERIISKDHMEIMDIANDEITGWVVYRRKNSDIRLLQVVKVDLRSKAARSTNSQKANKGIFH